MSESGETPPPKRRSLCEALSTPKPLSPAQRFGLKVYSTKDIDAVEGMNRRYRQFWNQKANEICSDAHVLRKLSSKKAVEGAIAVSWTLKKTDFLLIQVDEMRLLSSETYGEEAHGKDNIGKIEKNVDRMQKASFSASYTYQQAAETNLSNEAVQVLSESMTEEMTELKKAQQSLRRHCRERWRTYASGNKLILVNQNHLQS